MSVFIFCSFSLTDENQIYAPAYPNLESLNSFLNTQREQA